MKFVKQHLANSSDDLRRGHPRLQSVGSSQIVLTFSGKKILLLIIIIIIINLSRNWL